MSSITLSATSMTRRARPMPGPIRLARPTGRPSAIRLTRRGRLVVLLLTTTLGLAAFSVVQASVHASPSADGPVVSQVTVQPGETLWAIATRVAPKADRRDTIARIVEINGLKGSAIQAGQRIAVPATR